MSSQIKKMQWILLSFLKKLPNLPTKRKYCRYVYQKRRLRKEATGQFVPDLKPKNSFPTKVQSNRTTGRGKKNVNERGYNAAKKDREEPVGTSVHRYHGTLPPSVLSATCPPASSSPSSLSSSQSLPSSSLWWWHKKRDNDGADDLIVTQQWQQLVQLKGAGKASVTKYFRLHPHNFQLLTITPGW